MLRCPVEVPIGALDQPAQGLAPSVHRAKLCSVVSVPLGVILKTVPSPLAPPTDCCPVEVPIGGLDQARGGAVAVRAVEAVQRRQRAAWGDFEDRAIAVGPAIARCPVEVPVGGLDQPREGVGAVRAPLEKSCVASSACHSG